VVETVSAVVQLAGNSKWIFWMEQGCPHFNACGDAAGKTDGTQRIQPVGILKQRGFWRGGNLSRGPSVLADAGSNALCGCLIDTQ
jgi:hypothetical protein